MGIKGNHEKTIFLHPGSRMLERIADADAAYLRALPPRRDLTVSGRRLLLAHGSPWDDPDAYRCHYLSERDPKDLDRLREVATDIVLVGHTHHAMAIKVGTMTVLNPGSCGEGRDRAQRLSYAELDFSAGVATVYEMQPGVSRSVLLHTDI
jgi:predicted phosphodiesterase